MRYFRHAHEMAPPPRVSSGQSVDGRYKEVQYTDNVPPELCKHAKRAQEAKRLALGLSILLDKYR